MLDLLFVLFVYFGFFFVMLLFKSPLAGLNSLGLDNMAEKSLAEFQLISSALRTFFFVMIGGIILLFLLVVAGYSLFEGMAWCRILKKRFSFKYFRKFVLLNLAWFAFFAVLFFIFMAGLKQNALIIMPIFVFVFLYFTLILSVLFTQKNRFSQIKEALKKGVVKIQYFLLPLILIFITSFLASKINLIYKSLQVFAIIFNLVLFLLIFSWVKVYISDVIAHV